MMAISQAFKPAPGRIAVVREAVDIALARVKRDDGTEVEIVGADGALYATDVEYRRAINPWALVVGVGDPRLTDYGTTIVTDVKPGDKVLIAEIGKNVKLSAADGQEDYIYVLPFEGVIGTLEWACKSEGCGYRSRREIDVCPECPVIEAPGIADVLGVMI
jgi:co-chaperonin GroES (HSP10)